MLTSVRVSGVVLSVGLVLTAGCTLGGRSGDPSLLTLDRVLGSEFDGQGWPGIRWLKDGSGYTTREDSRETKDAQDFLRYDPVTGRREMFLPAASLVPAGESKPIDIQDFTWSEDSGKLLIFNNSQRVWRRNTRGDYWIVDRAGGPPRKLGGDAEPATLMFATLSPDGKRVAYVRKNNLYVQDLADLSITQLTSDGSDTIINGTSDWVYEEELDLRQAFCWSPDAKSIAYWQFDTSGVPEFSMINNTDALYPKITTFKYPKAGETNSACRVGVVSAAGGETRWFKPNDDPRNHYIARMEWSRDSSFVIFQHLNRLQNTNQIVHGDPQTGATRVLFTDRDDAWVDCVDDWRWLGKGETFLWLSERDGWRHLYTISKSGEDVTQLTRGAFDVIDVAGVDEALGCVYFIASPENVTQRYLYRAPLDGSAPAQRVTPADQPGSHSYDVSEDGRWALHTWSRFGRPPQAELVRLSDHGVIRPLADNADLVARLKTLRPCPTEFFRIDIGDGVQLDAWCIAPPTVSPFRRYPLLMHVYGEPAGATVVDSWGGDGYLWHYMLAQQGCFVMSVDNRGTAAPRGRDWRKSVYRQVGILASADQAAALRRIIATRPYIDPKRVGIWGWSGGGSMSLNAIFRYPDLYRAAVAVAFVSNERYYDTIYQERYMGLPSDNEAGYRDGSPITFAHQLEGRLMLIHGTADDNVHYQNCEALINELVKHNKLFSVMPYPNRSHGISEGDNTRRHLYELMTTYLHQNLMDDEH